MPIFCLFPFPPANNSHNKQNSVKPSTGRNSYYVILVITAMMRRPLSLIHLLTFALKGSEAFVSAPSFRELGASCDRVLLSRRRQNLRKCPSMMNALGNNEDSSNDKDADVSNDSGSNDDDDDVSFYADFREAKNEKLGAPIPDNYFAARAAIDSENDFLNAMKNAKAEFAEAKEEAGSVDGAAEKIIDGIRKEEELEAAWEQQQEQQQERQQSSTCSGGGDGNDQGKEDNRGADDDAFQ